MKEKISFNYYFIHIYLCVCEMSAVMKGVDMLLLSEE